MTEQYYSVKVGKKRHFPNRGEYPTGEDFYQASQLGVAPTGENVARLVGAAPVGEVAEIAQAAQAKKEMPTKAVVFQA